MKQEIDKKIKGFSIKHIFDFFARLNIVRKILIGYISLAVLIVVISVFSLISLERLNEINESIVQVDVPVLETADKMIDNLLAQELYARRYIILKSPDILNLFWERSREFTRMVQDVSRLSDRYNVLINRFNVLHKEYNDLFVEGMEHFKRPSSAMAREYNARIKDKQDELITLIKEVSFHAKREQNEKMLISSRIGMDAFRVAGVLSAIGIVLSITAAMVITKNISASIHQLKRATEEISHGRFEYKSKVENRDELGELALAFNEMAERLKRLEMMSLDASPLTRLPGGVAIENNLKKRLNAEELFAFCLCDMDNFKAFNDRYGYAKSSEVIKATARIIESAVGELGKEDDFIGHIGGDDFVIITSPERYSALADSIIEKFNKMIVGFYDLKDLEKGYIISRNRQGQQMKFPIMTMSIAVVTNQHRKLVSPVQIGEIAAELKEYAKSIPGSIFVVDNRRDCFKEGDNVINFSEKYNLRRRAKDA